jgi:hypothetical protein
MSGRSPPVRARCSSRRGGGPGRPCRARPAAAGAGAGGGGEGARFARRRRRLRPARRRRRPTLLTAVYAPGQVLVAAAAGPPTSPPYLGRLNDAGRDGIAEVTAMQEVLAATGTTMSICLANLVAEASGSRCEPWTRTHSHPHTALNAQGRSHPVTCPVRQGHAGRLKSLPRTPAADPSASRQPPPAAAPPPSAWPPATHVHSPAPSVPAGDLTRLGWAGGVSGSAGHRGPAPVGPRRDGHRRGRAGRR